MFFNFLHFLYFPVFPDFFEASSQKNHCTSGSQPLLRSTGGRRRLHLDFSAQLVVPKDNFSMPFFFSSFSMSTRRPREGFQQSNFHLGNCAIFGRDVLVLASPNQGSFIPLLGDLAISCRPGLESACTTGSRTPCRRLRTSLRND